MGVDAGILINPSIEAEDVRNILEILGKENIEIKPSGVASSYNHIIFNSKTKGQRVLIHFFYNTKDDYLGIPMNYLSARAYSESQEVLKQIVKMTGGLYRHEDTTDNWEMFRKQGAGNIAWYFDRFLRETKDIPFNTTKQIDLFNEFVKREKVSDQNE